MKIISKYKDYYDYLSGVWGIDPLIVLDRTSYDHLVPPDRGFGNEEYQFFICGKMICGYKLKGIDKILFGDDLIPYTEINTYSKKRYFKSEYLNFKWRREPLNLDLVDDASKLNEKENCPIIVKFNCYSTKLFKFPILSNFNFHRAISAEEIYHMLTEWLSRDRVVIKPISDKSKIELHGFSTKTSFRNM